MIQDRLDDLENIPLGEIDHFKIIVTTSQGSKLITLTNDTIMHVMLVDFCEFVFEVQNISGQKWMPTFSGEFAMAQ